MCNKCSANRLPSRDTLSESSPRQVRVCTFCYEKNQHLQSFDTSKTNVSFPARVIRKLSGGGQKDDNNDNNVNFCV